VFGADGLSLPPGALGPDGQPLPLLGADGLPLPGAENLTPAKRFWRKFGGDGFLVSLGVHILLIIIILTWVTAHYVINSTKPEDFVTGAGGGNQGNKVSMSEHRIKPKNARNNVKTPTRLVSKSASASVSIPDMPNLNMSALKSGNLAGATSKGLGGGAGGGIGSGIGPGRGGGKNMVSLFGTSGFNTPGLVGTLFDIKQTTGGTFKDPGVGGYVTAVQKFISSGWSESFLRANYFESKQKLTLQQVLMPLAKGNASEAPTAFEAPSIKPSRWIVHYKGAVKAPFSGKMRFVGMADDWITVRWQKQPKLIAGYNLMGTYTSAKPSGGKNAKAPAPPAGVGDTFPYLNRPPMQSGPWFTVTKGTEYDMEIAMGETPGGEFCAILAFQKENEKSPLYLFRMSGGPLPTMVTDGSKGEIPKNVDNTGGGMIWEPKMARASR
jgi:hypothetical protein